MEDYQFYLNISGSQLRCKVHPVVIFSILDHYIRRNDEEGRVIGALLGSNIDGTVEVTSCFPVPHSEGEQVGVDMDFHKNMLDLHLKASPKETMVGWYATGAEINEASAMIHDFFGSEMNQPPIHLTVDTTLTNNTMGIKAYTSTSIAFGDKKLGSQFLPIPLEIESFDVEKIGMDILIKAKNQQTPNGQALLADLGTIESSVSKLLEVIDIVQNYVTQVAEEKVEANPKIGKFLADAVAALPKMEPGSFEKMFNNNVQDLLMVVYLANLTRTQLSLADKLQRAV